MKREPQQNSWEYYYKVLSFVFTDAVNKRYSVENVWKPQTPSDAFINRSFRKIRAIYNGDHYRDPPRCNKMPVKHCFTVSLTSKLLDHIYLHINLTNNENRQRITIQRSK